MFPADPVGIGMMLEPMGLAAGPVVPTREWRELYAALDCAAVAAIHPFYTASVREFEAAGRNGRRLRRRSAMTVPKPGCRRSAEPANVPQARSTLRRTVAAGHQGSALAPMPIKGRITMSGYEGSELLVARLLVESGADLRYVGTACPQDAVVRSDREWLRRQGRARAVPRLAGTGPRGVDEFKPDLAIGTTPVVQAAKEAHPGAVLHQPDLGAPADGPGRCRLAGAGGQRRHRQQGPLRRHARPSSTASARATGRRLGSSRKMRPEFRALRARCEAGPQGRARLRR
jgi:3,8-divinyl chlorophyllide a/chlorophyllide a reductase subunit Y